MKAKSIFSILWCLAFLPIFVFTQTTITPDRKVIILTPKQQNDGWLSKEEKIPLKQIDPFLAYSLSWEGEWVDLYIRFSEDNRTWKDWIPIPEHVHATPADVKQVSELMFTDKKMQYFQLKSLNALSGIDNIQCHFYSPGNDDTPELPSAKNSSKIADRTLECPCEQPEYYDRQDWCPSNNCPPNPDPSITNVTHLIIHHSAGTNTSSNWAAIVRSIWDFHVNTRGWSDIGYNWLIDPNGKLYEGRGANVLGAHFCGTNSGTMGICVMGDYTNIVPTDEAKAILTHLLSWKACNVNIDPLGEAFHLSSGLTLKNISGHRDGCATQCPGNSFYPQLPTIRQAVVSFIASSCSPLPPPTLLEAEAVSDTKVNLSWSDNSQSEEAFSLERSKDFNTNFEEIILLEPNTITHQDTGLLLGTSYYYRLRAMNEADTTAYTNEVSVTTLFTDTHDIYFNENTVSLFPNPAINECHVKISNELKGKIHIELLDAAFRNVLFTKETVKEVPGTQVQLPVNGLPSGLYFLRLFHDKGSGVFKLVKR